MLIQNFSPIRVITTNSSFAVYQLRIGRIIMLISMVYLPINYDVYLGEDHHLMLAAHGRI